MKKMPTLFKRVFEGNRIVKVLPEVTPGCEWVLNGGGVATEKLDGACCAIIDGEFYKRFDYKPGRKFPEGAIPCQEKADEITGHFPHWVKVKSDRPSDKWYLNAYYYAPEKADGTYEAVGKHFNGNPYSVNHDTLIKHGEIILFDVPRDYEGIKKYLKEHYIEGIVFHRWNGEMCKIKRTDFGYAWGKLN